MAFQPASNAGQLVAQLSTIIENAQARFQYADTLGHAYNLLEQRKMPGIDQTANVDPLLRCLHAALAAEVYKSTELLGALCAFAKESPEDQFIRIMNVKQNEADKFYADLTEAPSDDHVREWFPFVYPKGLPVTPEQEEALTINDAALCRMLRDAVLLAKQARMFLGRFRNRFSHTYGLLLNGRKTKDGELGIFSIARELTTTKDGKLGWIDGTLLASRDNNERMIGILGLLLQAEDLVLRARVAAFVHGTPALLAKFHVPKEAQIDGQAMAEHYAEAFSKLGFVDITAKVQLNVELLAKHLQDADAFYRLLENSPFAKGGWHQ